ncbi:hypothetical protein LXL04_027499 [Taraxacum kok-saghyz]
MVGIVDRRRLGFHGVVATARVSRGRDDGDNYLYIRFQERMHQPLPSRVGLGGVFIHERPVFESWENPHAHIFTHPSLPQFSPLLVFQIPTIAMATRLLFASVPKTHPNTKLTNQSQHRTPFSAVAASRFLKISRLEASKTLETIFEEEIITKSNEGLEAVADALTTSSPLPSVSSSFLLSGRKTCLVQMQKHLKSDNFRCPYGKYVGEGVIKKYMCQIGLLLAPILSACFLTLVHQVFFNGGKKYLPFNHQVTL